MALIATCLGWIVTAGALLWVLNRLIDRQAEERQAHRIEVDAQRRENADAARSHREEIAVLNQARIEEVANLLQRIQAPSAATAEHAVRGALPDTPPLDLEDDDAVLAAQESMERLYRELDEARQ